MDLTILNLYWPHLAILPFVSLAMSYLGLHLTARHEVWKTFSFIQYIEFLKLLILGLGLKLAIDLPMWIIYTFLLIISLSYFFIKIEKFTHEFFFLMMILLQSASLFLVRLVPALETIWRNSFFGDVALIKNFDLIYILIICIIAILYFYKYHNNLLKAHFLVSLGINPTYFLKTKKHQTAFIFIMTLLITVSVILNGVLLTLSQLFLGPLIQIHNKEISFKSRYTQIAIVSLFGTFLGFLLSLFIDNLATTPSIILCQFIIYIIIYFLPKKKLISRQ